MARALSFCRMACGRLPQHHTTPQVRTGLPTVVRGLAPVGVLAFAAAVFPADSSLALDVFPNDKNTGVPKRWVPKQTYNRTVTISTRGAVLEDVRIYGDLMIEADDVTVRRVEILGGRIENWVSRCVSGLKLIRVTIKRAPGKLTSARDLPAIGTGGYTAVRVKVDGVAEGLRVGGRSHGCGRTKVTDTYIRVTAPDYCDNWHGDGIQGYDGPRLVIRNTTIDFQEKSGCYGTAAFFYPHSQGNQSVNIDGLLVSGGGAPFRLGMPGQVRGLLIEDKSWGYRPIDVKCSVIKSWEAKIVQLNKNYSIANVVRNQPCNTELGN